MAASSGDCSASGGGMGCASDDESASSTPFVSAASSPDRDPSSFSAAGCLYSAPSSPARDPSFSVAGCFYSVPASPARGGGQVIAEEYGCDLGFDFDFASHCPSPAVAAMSTADELFDNGQIRPMRLASFLRRPQALLPPHDGDVPPPPPQQPSEPPAPPAGADERGRIRQTRSMHHRRYRSLSPFRSHWLSSPAQAAKSVKPAAASRSSSSSSSTASSASSSSSSRNRRWGFLKGIFHRSKSDGGERPLLPKRSPSPSSPAAASRGRGWARRSAHARLYEARRAEAEEMRRRTFLPYRQGFLLGFLGLGSRGYGAMHGLAARP